MTTTELKNAVEQFNRETFGKLLGAVELAPEPPPSGTASIGSSPEAIGSSIRRDCFCGGTSKGYRSARDFVDTCLTLTDAQGTRGSVSVGVVIDAATAQPDEDLPIVIAVGINYGQGAGYLKGGVPTFAPTGLLPKLKRVYQSLAGSSCSARDLDEPFHLVAANFFPWITSQPWASYNFNCIEEAALLFCCGHADPQEYILELIRRINPVAVVFHGANNSVPFMGAEVVRRSIAEDPSPTFEVVFSDNLAGSFQPGVSNAIRLCCLDPSRAAMALADFDD